MINKALFSSNTNEWATPQEFFNALDAEFHFNLDPCATQENAKCERFYTIEDDGLTKDWGGGKSFLQSSIRQGHRQMGQEVLGGKQAVRGRGYAHPGQDGHGVFPRLHLWQGRDSFRPGSAAFQRE